MKSAPKQKIGRILTWNPDRREGWICVQTTKTEYRHYWFDWHSVPDLYFPVSNDRVTISLKAGKIGDVVTGIEFLRTGN